MNRTSAVVLVLTACVLPVSARAERVVTIDPADYASGTPVSAPAPGITLADLTLQQTSAGTSTTPAVFSPVLQPVYAYDGLFNPSPTSSGWWTAGGFYDPSTSNCLIACSVGDSTNFDLLEVILAKPTSYASVLEFNDAANYTFMQAFNSSGQLIGTCGGIGGGIGPYGGFPLTQSTGKPGCMTVVDGSDFDNTEWQFTISDSIRDISYLLIGGQNEGSEIGSVTVPAPTLPPAVWITTVGLGLLLATRRRRQAESQRLPAHGEEVLTLAAESRPSMRSPP